MKIYKLWSNGRLIESLLPGLYAGITTQKVFGCLDCKNGARAKRKNRIFFKTWGDAIKAGYRPCKLCQPEQINETDCGSNCLSATVRPNDRKLRFFIKKSLLETRAARAYLEKFFFKALRRDFGEFASFEWQDK